MSSKLKSEPPHKRSGYSRRRPRPVPASRAAWYPGFALLSLRSRKNRDMYLRYVSRSFIHARSALNRLLWEHPCAFYVGSPLPRQSCQKKGDTHRFSRSGACPQIRSGSGAESGEPTGVKNRPIRLPGLKPGDMRRVNTERRQPRLKKGVGGSERITAANEATAIIKAEGIIRESISGDLVGQETDEGSFRGNRQNVFERGVADAERVVLVPSPAS